MVAVLRTGQMKAALEVQLDIFDSMMDELSQVSESSPGEKEYPKLAIMATHFSFLMKHQWLLYLSFHLNIMQ